jgi:hypothetical protein
MMGASSMGWVKATFVFARWAERMRRHQGQKGLAIHLKAANVVLLRYVAGEQLSNPRLAGAAVSCTHTGLPRLIVGNHRLRIKQGEVGVIRFWLGLFTLYRVLDFKGKVSFNSVISEGRYISVSFMQEWIRFIPVFVSRILEMGGKRFRTDIVPQQFTDGWRMGTERFVKSEARASSFASLRTYHLYTQRYTEQLWGYVVRLIPLMKSGANSTKGSTSVSNIVIDMVSWLSRPAYVCHLITLVMLTRAYNLIDNPAWRAALAYIDEIKIARKGELVRSGAPASAIRAEDLEIPAQGTLGRLSLVEEPGKMRVVAMVDCLSQWILYPLHRFIFDKILRVIPQDGTFDQQKPVKKLIERMEKENLFEVFSYDLSAATDRLPVSMQEFLLGAFTSREFAHHWRCFLTNRYYQIPRKYKDQLPSWAEPLFREKCVVKYRVGQPMGAYSSWAMLALVHHAIVQFAAKRANVVGWFELYAVLGDDVVIGHRGVAAEYVKIMEDIGVNIGFHKSIISKNRSLEFAKRFYYKGVEVTPLPLVAIAVAWTSLNGVPEIVKTVQDRVGKFPSLYSISRSMGLGFKASTRAATSRIVKLPKRLRSMVVVLTRPGTLPWSRDTLWEWIRLRSVSYVSQARAEYFGPMMDRVRQLIDAKSPQSVRKGLFRAFTGFNLPHEWAERGVGLHDWWTTNVVKPYKEPMFEVITEYEQLVATLHQKTEEDAEEVLSDVLELHEQLERLSCRLPVKVDLKRNMEVVISGSRERFPKTVRRWRQFNRLLRKSSSN